nr:hypothetical protein Iba_chr15aCG6100 [Ipomoea batatas]
MGDSGNPPLPRLRTGRSESASINRAVILFGPRNKYFCMAVSGNLYYPYYQFLGLQTSTPLVDVKILLLYFDFAVFFLRHLQGLLLGQFWCPDDWFYSLRVPYARLHVFSTLWERSTSAQRTHGAADPLLLLQYMQ